MKTRLIILILILNCMNTVAQGQRVWPTKNLDAYVGTWVYQKNDTVFKISLQKTLQTGGLATHNVLLGGYSLSVRGVVVEYYMKTYPSLIDFETYTNTNQEKVYIWATNSTTRIEDVDPDELRMIFYDQRKLHFNGKGLNGGRINLLSPNQIRWFLDEKLGIRLMANIMEDLDIRTVPLIGFSVPSDVIMTKEE